MLTDIPNATSTDSTHYPFSLFYNNKLINIINFLFIFITLVLLHPDDAISHSGGTDYSGGHYNKKNGKYHYHNAGNSSKREDSSRTYKRNRTEIKYIENKCVKGKPCGNTCISMEKECNDSDAIKNQEKENILRKRKYLFHLF